LKKGKLESADKGTLFLDEIGELALPAQAKLLRVLQEREVDTVGATRAIRIDIRLVASTNRDLAQKVEEGGFRRDLYHRLNVVMLKIPPLAQHFLAHFGEPSKILPAEASHCLEAYDWPGNVRELANAMEHAAVMETADQ
jgi:transcriptional regulator with PAS, ATPase and Fis domain